MERDLKVAFIDARKGRGVISQRTFRKGQLVEVAPILFKFKGFSELKKEDLAQYELAWGKDVAMGGGLLHFYNHSYRPNVAFERDLAAGVVRVRALRSIKKNEELCHRYACPVWFYTEHYRK